MFHRFTTAAKKEQPKPPKFRRQVNPYIKFGYWMADPVHSRAAVPVKLIGGKAGVEEKLQIANTQITKPQTEKSQTSNVQITKEQAPKPRVNKASVKVKELDKRAEFKEAVNLIMCMFDTQLPLESFIEENLTRAVGRPCLVAAVFGGLGQPIRLHCRGAPIFG